MEIQCTWGYVNLPSDIKNQLVNANIYYSSQWDSYTRARGERMCYLWDENYILNIRVKTVLFLSGGILDSEPFALSYNTSSSAEAQFLTDCCHYLKKTKITWVECGPGACFQTYPQGAVVLRRGNYVLDLRHSDDELMKIIHSKQRNMIRRAMKENVTLKRNSLPLLKDYKSIEDEVWERNEMPCKPLSYYETMYNSLPDSCSIAVAYQDNVPQAGGIFLYTPTMAYYHHGASHSGCTPGSHAYLLWDEFLYLRDKGVQKINFVGYRPGLDPSSKGYRIQHFKERFGGQLVGTYFFKYVSRRFLFFLYRLSQMILNHENYHDFYDTQSKDYPELNGR